VLSMESVDRLFIRRPSGSNPLLRCGGSPTSAKFLGLLKRSGGATGKEFMKATGWQGSHAKTGR
jgi:hypothetical protein